MARAARKPLIPHAAADVFPLMDDQRFDSLKSDISNHGVREPIVLLDGRILDGRNRYRACCELDIDCPTREWNGNGSQIAFVWSVNGERRDLTPSQRAAVAAEIEPMLAAEAKKRQTAALKKGTEKPVVEIVPQRDSADDGKAREQAAKITGASGRYVSEAKAVKEKDPELFEQVKSGEVTLPQARREVQRREKREELETKAKRAPKKSDSWEIVNGDCVKVM